MSLVHSLFPRAYSPLAAVALVWSAVLMFCLAMGLARLMPTPGWATSVMMICAIYGLFAWRVAGYAEVSSRLKLHLRIVAGVVLTILSLVLLNELNYRLFVQTS